jgi:hypothetical protein
MPSSAPDPADPATLEALARPVELCGVAIGPRAHVCAFFGDREEEDEALLPFIKEGLSVGDGAFYTVEPTTEAARLARLEAAGVDVKEHQRHGALGVCSWNETHLPSGYFNPETTLAFYRGVIQSAKQRGRQRTRFLTQMGWAARSLPQAEELLEYEARANYLWLDQVGPVDPVICSYDLSLFGADVLVGVMQTHPMVLIGGVVQQNPFFIEPDKFLHDRRTRRAKRRQEP